ncbi:hypothetical protein I6I42_05330 [Morganella morganii]|nr:hypothetical protein I6I42_05330 [Morganella morganii]
MSLLKHTSLTTQRLLFFVFVFCYTSMVGRAGASKDAPVSVRPVRLTSSGSPPVGLASPVVDKNTTH